MLTLVQVMGVLMKVVLFLLLMSLLACSEADGLAEPADEPVPAEREEIAVVEEVEPLPSLDDLLPADFAVLTNPWFGDLTDMAERRVIRTLVVASGPQFFYYDGKPRGLVAELLGLLQGEVNVALDRKLDKLEIVPMPVSRDRLIPSLLAGEADLVAADLTKTRERSELVEFSAPFASNVDEVVVFAPNADANVEVLEQLAGHTIMVRKSSSYYEHLEALNKSFIERGLEPIRIEPANELLRTEDILEMVNAGIVPATVVDSYKATSWASVFTDIDVRLDLAIHESGDIAWAFRKDSPELAAVVNDFIRGHKQGTLIGNVLMKRYFENLHWVRNSTSKQGLDRLQPLLKHFRDSGMKNRIDPLMLAAQAYQESELEHDRQSSAGAVGIMQIKPSTAADRNVGIKDVSTPGNNIEAGAKYMRFLMDRYYSDSEMEGIQQWLFALASYNAGPAKIQRLRKQAAAEGYNPNVWIDNVELIAARKIGRETVTYVRNVFKYYVAYRLASQNRQLREAVAPQ